MKRTLLTIAASLLLAVSSFAGELSVASLSCPIFNANGDVHQAKWVNTTGLPVYVKHVQIFTGICAGGMADYPTSISRTSDGMLIAFVGLDHYEDSAGDHNNHVIDFGDDWITIVPGDGVTLRTFAKGYQKVAPYQYELNYNWTIQTNAWVFYSTTQD
jgi:hypothetical protein